MLIMTQQEKNKVPSIIKKAPLLPYLYGGIKYVENMNSPDISLDK